MLAELLQFYVQDDMRQNSRALHAINMFSCVFQNETLGKIEGFQTPSQNALGPENIGSQVMHPTRVDTPTVVAAPNIPPSSNSHDTMQRRTSLLRTLLPPPPGENIPRASIDSGIGISAHAELHRPPFKKSGSSSVPNSGSGTFSRGVRSGSAGHSADAEFFHRVPNTVSFVFQQSLLSPSFSSF